MRLPLLANWVFAVVFMVAFAFLANAVHAASPTDLFCGEIWSVSTHGLCAAEPSDEASPRTQIKLPDGGWHPAELDDLMTSDWRSQPTCIYIHGNNNTEQDGLDGALAVQRALASDVGCPPEWRLVAWCWPSERIRGPVLNNVRVKADLAELEARRLAEFLRRLPPDADVVLWGHSFGARLTTAALHLLAGGELCGFSLGESADACQPRALLTAAALDSHWLYPGARHGCGLHAAEHALILVSPADPVLKRYDRLYADHDPQALGGVGLNTARLAPEHVDKVCQINVSPMIGLAHVSKRFLRSRHVVELIRDEITRRADAATPPDAATPTVARR